MSVGVRMRTAQPVPSDPRTIPVILVLISTGLGGLAMLALGCELVVPLSSGLASLCDIAAVPLLTMFCAALDNQ